MTSMFQPCFLNAKLLVAISFPNLTSKCLCSFWKAGSLGIITKPFPSFLNSLLISLAALGLADLPAATPWTIYSYPIFNRCKCNWTNVPPQIQPKHMGWYWPGVYQMAYLTLQCNETISHHEFVLDAWCLWCLFWKFGTSEMIHLRT